MEIPKLLILQTNRKIYSKNIVNFNEKIYSEMYSKIYNKAHSEIYFKINGEIHRGIIFYCDVDRQGVGYFCLGALYFFLGWVDAGVNSVFGHPLFLSRGGSIL